MNIKDNLLYTKTHEWVELEDAETCYVGLTDYAQDMLGDIVYVRLPDVSAAVTAGEAFTDLESVKAVSDVYSPVTGEIAGVNDGLEADPGLINTDPYAAWIARIEFSAIDKAALMDAAQYAAFVEGLKE